MGSLQFARWKYPSSIHLVPMKAPCSTPATCSRWSAAAHRRNPRKTQWPRSLAKGNGFHRIPWEGLASGGGYNPLKIHLKTWKWWCGRWLFPFPMAYGWILRFPCSASQGVGSRSKVGVFLGWIFVRRLALMLLHPLHGCGISSIKSITLNLVS